MANLITLIRFPLLFVYVALLYSENPTVIFWCVPFIILISVLDAVDGLIARALGEVSLLGSVLDIATDRTLEMVLWVVFAHIGLIPVIIPLLVIARGTTVDAVRAVGMRDGKRAFDQVQHPISRFLVSSRFMRDTYGIAKGAAFGLLTLTLALQVDGSSWSEILHLISLIVTWVCVIMMILRGLPVLIEGYSLLKETPSNTKDTET